MSYFDFMLQDNLFQRPALTHPDIIVIGIDEHAIYQFGMPGGWSRDIMASAINILNTCEEYRPAVIALDILYVGESGDACADERLAMAARYGGNVVAAARAVAGYRQSLLNPGRVIRAELGFERPFAALARYARYGAVNAIHDDDGRIRSTRLVYQYADETVYSFPYEIYRKFLGINYPHEPWMEYTEIYIRYHAPPGTFRQFSFADIFDEYFEPEFLAGAIVLIGAFAPGLFDDFDIPGSAERMYGVEIHANILQMLLEGNIIRYAPDYINWIAFLLILALSFALANILEIRILLASFAAVAGLYVGAVIFLFNRGHIISAVYVVISLVIIYIYQLIYSYVLETIARRKAQLIAEKHEILMDSINCACEIQKGILPKDSLFSHAFADYSVIWEPRDTVGGDIYWIKSFEEGTVLSVCDCTGHGVPGALLTSLVMALFEEIVNEDTCKDPAAIIYMLDRRIARIFEVKPTQGKRARSIKNGCDLAVLFVAKNGDVSIASGNVDVYFCDGNEVERVKGQRINVGEGKIQSREDVRVTVVPANEKYKFYISSDGLYDQIGGAHGHSFGLRTFKQLILEHHNKNQESISNIIWDVFESYRGNHVRLDDFELITFKPHSL